MEIINDTYELVGPATLKRHPRNPNQGDVGAIVQSIESNGFFGALVVQRSTGYVLAGNHRLDAARQIGLTHVPVTWVECDERTATKILLADNRTAELGMRDPEALATLLTELAHDDDLGGTGYDGDDLDALLAALDPLEAQDWADAFDGLSDSAPLTRQVSFQLDSDRAEWLEGVVTRAMSDHDLDRGAALCHLVEAGQ